MRVCRVGYDLLDLFTYFCYDGIAQQLTRYLMVNNKADQRQKEILVVGEDGEQLGITCHRKRSHETLHRKQS